MSLRCPLFRDVTVDHNHMRPPCNFPRDDKVLAVCSLNSDPVVSQAAELMFQGKMPSASQLR